MKHAQRETALRPRYLIVIKLHRIDGAASELIVLGVGSEDRAQQNARLDSFGVFCGTARITLKMADSNVARMRFQFFPSSISPHMPLYQS